MKYFYSIIIIIFLAITSTNAYAIGKEFIGKIGTSYAHELKNWGLDSSLNFNLGLDPYFVIGAELDFFWIRWEQKLGERDLGQTSEDVIKKTDTFSFPLFFNAQVRIPILVKYIYVEPAIIAGLGYSMCVISYSQPHFQDTSGKTYNKENVTAFYHGFAWQVLTSIYFKPAKESNIEFVFDFGYRGMSPEKWQANRKFESSGLLLRLGVKFFI